MKKFNVSYTYSMSDEVTIKARNEKEAIKKFREMFPNVDFEDVWELRETTNA